MVLNIKNKCTMFFKSQFVALNILKNECYTNSLAIQRKIQIMSIILAISV